MHRALTARLLNRALKIGEVSPLAGVPLYLCPALGRSSSLHKQQPTTSLGTRYVQRRVNHVEAGPTSDAPIAVPEPPITPARRLPLTCSGCGAFSQKNDADQLGYFDVGSKRVRTWLHPQKHEQRPSEAEEDKLVEEVLKSLEQSQLQDLKISPAAMLIGEESEAAALSAYSPDKPPICDRCHNLMHYSTTSDSAKVTMFHPSVESLRETIEESPHKYNHIYHVIDAADFPMSLIPRLNVLLGDIPLRTRNRRSRASKYQHDRKTELSFVITRSDLLGPTKEMVDALMPYLRDVLRDALGRLGGRVRLGNVRCVSAKRSWWTKEVREDIWDRGGAGWMVGKVNVGKSQLFEAVYPKGRMTDPKDANHATVSTYPREAVQAESMLDKEAWKEDLLENVELGDLLPPPQPAQNYPEMPIVSSLPGTTASPIRIPFGNGRGELIDLPGLARSDLELFVKEEHRQSIIMKKRIVPEQISLKLGKSLILGGGLIRITPRTPDLVFLMYNFTPLNEHLTMTEKAIGFQNQERESIGLENITLQGVGGKMKHAGTFKLSHDVTKKRAGPLTRKNAVGLQVDRLPFRVVSVDILIEGVGYIEVVAQIRAREFDRLSKAQEQTQLLSEQQQPLEDEPPQPAKSRDPFAAMFSERRDSKPSPPQSRRQPQQLQQQQQPPPVEVDWPSVDVYTPEGRFVGSRSPINGWLNNKPRVLPEHKRSRPRRSMKGQKKMSKQHGRSNESAN